MKVIIDANVLFRTLISPGTIVLLFFNDHLELFAPERLREEFHKNKEEILQKSTLPEKEFEEFAQALPSSVNTGNGKMSSNNID